MGDGDERQSCDARLCADGHLNRWMGVAKADTFNFSYTGFGISAIGTLTATMQSSGWYLINAISRTRNGVTITALIAPGAFQSSGGKNDNILKFPANPGYLAQ